MHPSFSRPRRPSWSALALVAAAAACGACASKHRPPTTLATLESARQLRYYIPTPVHVEPNGAGQPGTADQLRYWVAQYMVQVGLPLAEDASHPYDVELPLTLSAHGGTVLAYGTAGIRVMAANQLLDQWSTGDHVEPTGNFARTLARDLVEWLVHSTRLAAHADARSGAHRRPGVEVAAVAPEPIAGGSAPASLMQAQPASLAARPASGTSVTAGPVGGSPASGTAGARAHTRQGSAYYDLNRFREAYTEFEQAYLMEQDPALLYNMGQCQRKLGNTEEALHFYKTYLRRAPQGPSSAEAEKRIHELEDAIAHGRK